MRFVVFEDRIAFYIEQLKPAEQRVARTLLAEREQVLVASAASLALKAKTSDATVVRTVRRLGYAGMDDLRHQLAAELGQSLTIADRLVRTLHKVGDETASAFNVTLDIHRDSIEQLRREITSDTFGKAVKLIRSARRIAIFGIGPSGAIVDYFATQLRRFGFDASCLSNTGLLFADDLHQLRPHTVLIVLAYTNVYREVSALLSEATRLKLKSVLLTDTLANKLRGKVDLVLPVARGRVDMLSMHTATLGLIEALLVGIASKKSKTTVQNLEALNILREQLVGRPIALPIKQDSARGREIVAANRREPAPRSGES
ncbi:MAG: MurR/RpiR family transcriptional regulator [Proteobacteria bacterium]|nr:MurR/RpiR family transcriptional regulator [Pseudomonadota bacterium]